MWGKTGPCRPSRGDTEPKEDMAQGMSRQGHPVRPVIHLAFMDVPGAMIGTASDSVGLRLIVGEAKQVSFKAGLEG